MHTKTMIVIAAASVRSQEKRNRAEQVARRVDGVTRIENRIAVNPDSAAAGDPSCRRRAREWTMARRDQRGRAR